MTTETVVATTTAAHRVSKQEFINADIEIFKRSTGGLHISIRKRDGSPVEDWYLSPREVTNLGGDWTPCSKQMPPAPGVSFILGITVHNVISPVFYGADRRWYRYPNGIEQLPDDLFTHWMSLPEPPE